MSAPPFQETWQSLKSNHLEPYELDDNSKKSASVMIEGADPMEGDLMMTAEHGTAYVRLPKLYSNDIQPGGVTGWFEMAQVLSRAVHLMHSGDRYLRFALSIEEDQAQIEVNRAQIEGRRERLEEMIYLCKNANDAARHKLRYLQLMGTPSNFGHKLLWDEIFLSTAINFVDEHVKISNSVGEAYSGILLLYCDSEHNIEFKLMQPSEKQIGRDEHDFRLIDWTWAFVQGGNWRMEVDVQEQVELETADGMTIVHGGHGRIEMSREDFDVQRDKEANSFEAANVWGKVGGSEDEMALSSESGTEFESGEEEDSNCVSVEEGNAEDRMSIESESTTQKGGVIRNESDDEEEKGEEDTDDDL